MIKLLRYSATGFTPLFQHEMDRHIQYLMNFTPESLNDIQMTDFSKALITQTVEENRRKINHKIELNGVHVFFVDNVSSEDIRFLLNHLSKRPEGHYLEVEDNTLGYKLYEPYLQSFPIKLSKLHKNKHYGAYIPGSQLIEGDHY